MTQRARSGKAILLIALKKEEPAKAFEETFRKEAEKSRDGAEAWSLPIGEDEIPRIAHQVLMADSPPPFDAVVQLRSDGATTPLVNRLAEIAEQLDTWIDKSRSVVLIGEEIKITIGDGPVLIVMPLRRLPALSHEQFMSHWFERHADLGEAVEGVRYRQNHVDYAATNTLAERLGFNFEPLDGLTESYFGSAEEAFALMSREEVAVGAIEDEKQFIDHFRSHFGFYRTL